MEFDLLNVLGKDADSSEVRNAIKKYGLVDIQKSPPNGRYHSSHKKGLSLLIENDRVKAIQIHVQPSKSFTAFSEPLPFGIKTGMKQKQVHDLLGPPTEPSEISSRFEMPLIKAKLAVRYDDAMVVKFLNIGYAGA